MPADLLTGSTGTKTIWSHQPRGCKTTYQVCGNHNVLLTVFMPAGNYACFVLLCHLSHQSLELSHSQNNSVWEGDHTQVKCFSVFFVFLKLAPQTHKKLMMVQPKNAIQAKAWVEIHRFMIALLWHRTIGIYLWIYRHDLFTRAAYTCAKYKILTWLSVPTIDTTLCTSYLHTTGTTNCRLCGTLVQSTLDVWRRGSSAICKNRSIAQTTRKCA